MLTEKQNIHTEVATKKNEKAINPPTIRISISVRHKNNKNMPTTFPIKKLAKPNKNDCLSQKIEREL
ncbi:hypothetical protein FACS1894192_08220 [Bacilli bacterium]|nr:hypothetical protein FACS1894192_08220 [Bacilli bacterium]